MRVVLTGGGTGGHLIPLEPIIDSLRVKFREDKKTLPAWIGRRKLEIIFIGVTDKKTDDFFKRLDIKTISIPAAKLRRYPSPRTVSDFLFRLPVGLFLSLWHMWRLMPDVVISKGGYGSIPVTLAAWFYRIPFLLHESDSVSGLANRVMASLATVITVGFASTRHEIKYYQDKTVVTGTPVRKYLLTESSEASKKHFGLDVNEPVLLVMGGSQGAKQLNELVLEVLPSLIEDMAIIHLTGPDHFNEIKKLADDLLSSSSRGFAYKPFGYLTDDMSLVLTAADLIVTRAGATALAEAAYLKKPTIVVPLPSAAQDHQRENARVYDLAHAVRVISPENLGRSLFEQNVRALMLDESLRKSLSENIAAFDHPNAARDISDLCFKMAMGLQPFQPKVKSGDNKKI